MNLRITKEIKALIDRYLVFGGSLNKVNEIMYQMAENAGNAIRDRNKNGVMVNGKPFPDYSKGWAKYRASKGRNLNADRLTFTGKLMQNMQAEKTGSGAKLHFPSGNFEDIAAGNHARTPFFGLRKQEREALMSDVYAKFQKMTKRQK